MKNKLLLLVACLLTLTSLAQENKKKIKVGVKAGLALASLSPDFTDSLERTMDYQSKIIFTGGVRVELPLGKNFLLLPELNLVDKFSKRYTVGPTYNYSSTPGGEIFLEFVLNFLWQSSLPKTNFFLGAGPSVAINTRNHYARLSNSDFGVNALAGCKFPSDFSVELNFNNGLKKQHSQFTYDLPGPPNLTTSTLALTFGYTF